MKFLWITLKNLWKAFVMPTAYTPMPRTPRNKPTKDMPEDNVNNHHGLYNRDVDGYRCEILYCSDCDMAGHLHTLGVNCPICSDDMVAHDGTWDKRLQRWVVGEVI